MSNKELELARIALEQAGKKTMPESPESFLLIASWNLLLHLEAQPTVPVLAQHSHPHRHPLKHRSGLPLAGLTGPAEPLAVETQPSGLTSLESSNANLEETTPSTPATDIGAPISSTSARGSRLEERVSQVRQALRSRTTAPSSSTSDEEASRGRSASTDDVKDRLLLEAYLMMCSRWNKGHAVENGIHVEEWIDEFRRLSAWSREPS